MAEDIPMELVNDYVKHLEYELHRSTSTVRGYRDELARFVKRRVRLEPQALAEWIATGDGGQVLAPTTRNRRRIILRGFLDYLVRRGVLATNPTAAVKRARVPRNRRVALRADDLRKVIAVLRQGAPGWRRSRDETIIVLLFNVGLRINELRSLDLDQVDLAGRNLLAARRKGGGMVDAFLNAEAVESLAAWILERPASRDQALFIGGARLQRLTVRYIQKRLRGLGKAAHLPRSLHPHGVRRSHATELHGSGADIRTIGDSLNHSSVRTTEIYVDADEELLRKALANLPRLSPSASTNEVDPKKS